MAERNPDVPARDQLPETRRNQACRPEQIDGEVPEAAECPACGASMRLWAAYYRCRNCGFKESCCF